MSAALTLGSADVRPHHAGAALKILLVDDIDANLLALSGVLCREGAELVHAHSGRDALELLLVNEFALAIIDVQMPGMNGFELAELMRGTERTRHIPIIFITAGAQNQEHRFRGYEVGAVDFLFKPIEPDILRSKVAVFLNLHRVRQELARQRDELARSEQDLATELDGARKLQELSTRLIQSGDLTSLYQEIVDTAVKVMSSDFGSLQILDKSSARPGLHLLAYRGLDSEAAQFWRKVDLDSDGAFAAALRTGQRVIIPDVLGCALIAGAADRDFCSGTGIRAMQSTPLCSRSGELIGVLSTQWRQVHEPVVRELRLLDVVARQAADLIERAKLENAILRNQKMESLGLLAGGVAHDFNNLLVGVLGNASLAVDSLPPGHPLQPTLARIVTAAERAAHLTRQMLAYAGKGQVLIEPIDMPEVVCRTCDLAQASVPNHVRLTIETGRELPPVQGDSGQIEQIVMNLVLNAAESIEDRKRGFVRVKTYLVDSDSAHPQTPEFITGELDAGPHVVVEVQDSGCGMDSATKARILDPFFTTKFTGRGLGLAALDGILRTYRGALQIESAVGQGSTFRVFLPASRAAMPVAKTQTSKPAPRGAGAILVVDDEEVVRKAATMSLERSGYSVRAVEGGEEAVKLLLDATPAPISLILLDMSMPGMSGKELLRQIRALGFDTPVLISSGYSEAQVNGEFSGLDIAGFVPKPFTPRQLAERVSRVLTPC